MKKVDEQTLNSIFRTLFRVKIKDLTTGQIYEEQSDQAYTEMQRINQMDIVDEIIDFYK